LCVDSRGVADVVGRRDPSVQRRPRSLQQLCHLMEPSRVRSAVRQLGGRNQNRLSCRSLNSVNTHFSSYLSCTLSARRTTSALQNSHRHLRGIMATTANLHCIVTTQLYSIWTTSFHQSVCLVPQLLLVQNVFHVLLCESGLGC